MRQAGPRRRLSTTWSPPSLRWRHDKYRTQCPPHNPLGDTSQEEMTDAGLGTAMCRHDDWVDTEFLFQTNNHIDRQPHTAHDFVSYSVRDPLSSDLFQPYLRFQLQTGERERNHSARGRRSYRKRRDVREIEGRAMMCRNLLSASSSLTAILRWRPIYRAANLPCGHKPREAILTLAAGNQLKPLSRGICLRVLRANWIV